MSAFITGSNIFNGVRWLKLLRDMQAEKGRVLLMLAAIAVSLAAVGSVMGAYSVLSREMAVNYLGTHPAQATLEFDNGVNENILRLARQHPAVLEAEARDVLLARAKIGADWRPLLLFVVDDFSTLQMNLFTPVSGSWPPPAGTMLIEHTAVSVLDSDVGGQVRVKTPHGSLQSVTVSGKVHDPGLAPAWQERAGYGYIARATLTTLGEQPVLHELRISLREPLADSKMIESVAAALAQQLAAQGYPVHEIRVPPPRQHPHQRQMITMLFMMLAFSVMALVLSSILVANSLAAMLARQVREIGVMKTIGAQTRQIVGLYALLVACLGVLAVAVAIPAAQLGAYALANAVAGLLNLTISSNAFPLWVFAVQILAGILLPLLLAALPIIRSSRISVHAALDQHGVSSEKLRNLLAKFPPLVRNVLRRPARFLLTVALLSAGGAMFMTALNVSYSWQRNIAKVYETRHYDVEVRFSEAQMPSVAQRIRELPEVKAVEVWGYSPAALARKGQVTVVRTYPDKGHASFAVMAPPANTQLVSFPLLAGRWLQPEDREGVVLNHAIAAQLPQVKVGDAVDLSLDGNPVSLRVTGIVEEIGAAGVAYITDKAFAEIAGTGGDARMLRIATRAESPEARIQAIRSIEQRLSDDGVGVETAVPLAELRTAMADHILILIRALMAMALVMAIVGALGLTSAMSTSVVERTREFAVMKTIGATAERITRMVLAESLFVGMLSWVTGLLLSLPLTLLLDTLVGNLGFVAPLPFVISPMSVFGWILLSVLVALIATWLPARNASRLSVAQALVQL